MKLTLRVNFTNVLRAACKLRAQLFCAYILGLYLTGARLLAQKLCIARWWNWPLVFISVPKRTLACAWCWLLLTHFESLFLSRDRTDHIYNIYTDRLLDAFQTVTIQVSLAIRGGYVPEKFGIHEYQNPQFMH